MRNPQVSVKRLPRSRTIGAVVGTLLSKAVGLWPEMQEASKAILTGREAVAWPTTITDRVRTAVLKVLNYNNEPIEKTARANSPISVEVLRAWANITDDPDARNLADWLVSGAPLGFTEDIPRCGVFPPVEGPRWEDEALLGLSRSLEGWSNYGTAVEGKEEVHKLINDYMVRGMCHLVATEEEVEKELGRPPLLNKLGLITKVKEDGTKKHRLIWDLRESKANLACSQGERIMLPKLMDVAEAAVAVYRNGKQPWIAVADIQDAFLNIPSGRDKFATTAAVEMEDGKKKIVVFDTLVFGSASSPTLWGRYAAWMGRTLASVVPTVSTQVYVDDPSFVLRGTLNEAASDLAMVLLWLGVAGFPLKLSKAGGGKAADWVGARIEFQDDVKEVHITIPANKVKQLGELTDKFLARPVVGAKELRSYAGMLSFVAGLVPHLRPFLASIWAALGPAGSASDGAPRPSGKLIHVRRIRPALCWVRALLGGEVAPFVRVVPTVKENFIKAEIVTDACPFGMGGILRIDGEPKEYYAVDISEELQEKFAATRGDSKWNTLWEAVALLVAARLWLPGLGYGVVVRIKSDNMSALISISKGKAKTAELNIVAREFAIDQAKKDYLIKWLEHIPGVTNVQADALSRATAPIPKEFPSDLVGCLRRRPTLGQDFWIVRDVPDRKLGKGWGACFSNFVQTSEMHT